MRVLIVGSTKPLEARKNTQSLRRDHRELPSVEAFREACKSIGRVLAREGHELVVGSDSCNTADRHVVQGAGEIDGRHTVWVLRPERGDAPFSKSESSLPDHLNFRFRRLRGSWSAGRVPQVLAADAVVLIGGGHGTQNVGLISPALERPVVTIGGFGGAAQDLWQDLKPYYVRSGDTYDLLLSLQDRWKCGHAELVAKAIKDLAASRLFRARSIARNAGIFLSLVALFCLWSYLFVTPRSIPPGYRFFSILGVSAVLGTGLRVSLRDLLDPNPSFSWGAVLNELSAGLLLALGLVMMYLVGAFTVTGDASPVQLLGEPGGFRRASVVVTLLGLSGGLLIEQVAEALRSWLSGRLPGGSE